MGKENMNKEILVDANKFAIRVAVVEDGTPVELYVEQNGTERLEIGRASCRERV